MDFQVRWIDVTPNLARKQQPVVLVERPLAHGTAPKGGVFNVAEVARLGTFWVPVSDLNASEIQWSKTASGQFVRIPMLGYRSAQPAESALFGMALQLGIKARDALQQQTASPVLCTWLALGHQVHNLGPEGYRGYLGLAFQIKE